MRGVNLLLEVMLVSLAERTISCVNKFTIVSVLRRVFDSLVWARGILMVMLIWRAHERFRKGDTDGNADLARANVSDFIWGSTYQVVVIASEQ